VQDGPITFVSVYIKYRHGSIFVDVRWIHGECSIIINFSKCKKDAITGVASERIIRIHAVV